VNHSLLITILEHYGARGNTPFEAHNGHLSGHYITDNNTPAD